jgi:hypothetical protein
VDACVRDCVEPDHRLRFDVGVVDERAPVEEIVLDVENHPLALPFSAGPPDAMRLNCEAVVVGKIDEVWVQLPGVRQTNLGHVVVEDALRDAAKIRECPHMAAQQDRKVHRRGKANEQRPGEAQYADERVERDLNPLRIDERAALRPVHLSLLSGRCFEPYGGASGGLDGNLHLLNVPPQRTQRARVTHRPDFFEQSNGRQIEVVVPVLDVGLELVQARLTLRRIKRLWQLFLQNLADRPTGMSRKSRDGAHRVAITVKLFNIHPFLQIDQVRAP